MYLEKQILKVSRKWQNNIFNQIPSSLSNSYLSAAHLCITYLNTPEYQHCSMYYDTVFTILLWADICYKQHITYNRITKSFLCDTDSTCIMKVNSMHYCFWVKACFWAWCYILNNNNNKYWHCRQKYRYLVTVFSYFLFRK